MSTYLVTGAAGFIGFHTSLRLLEDGHRVVGVDNVNDYYSPQLKRDRLRRLEGWDQFDFHLADVRDAAGLAVAFHSARPAAVIDLAAQAGVRHSLAVPMDYVQSNVVGFMNVLEQSHAHQVEHLVYASSSSVYGETSRSPFDADDPADHPVSMYAATKRANELMAHSFSHLHGLPTTGLRFFSVYGPWGRPDMAYFRFASAILDEEPITVYGTGEALRDFTFVDDIVDGVVKVVARPPSGTPGWTVNDVDAQSTSTAPWRLYNIGHGEQISVNDLVRLLESQLGLKAVRNHEPAVDGDVLATHAETMKFQQAFGVQAATPVAVGMARFVEWFRDYREGNVNAGW